MKAAQIILALLTEDLKLPKEQRMPDETRLAYLARLPKRKPVKRVPADKRKKKGPQSDESRVYTLPGEGKRSYQGYVDDEATVRIRAIGAPKIASPTKTELQQQHEESKKNKFLESLGDVDASKESDEKNPVASN